MKSRIILSTIVLLVALALPFSCGGSGDADFYAQEYAERLGEGFVSMGCVGKDSDEDGYVSCTIKHPDGDRSGVLCARGITATGCNSGCKEVAGVR